MTTEQFIEERQQLIETIRTLLNDPLDLWSVDDIPHDHMVVSRLIGKQNSGNAVTLHIDYCYAGSVKVAVDDVRIMLSASFSDALVVLMSMFKDRWHRRVQDAEQEKESKAIQALALAMAATRISANCKVTVTPIETLET